MLRSAALAGAALASVLLAPPASAKPCPGGDVMPNSGNTAATRHATLCLLNRERRMRGLRHLRQSASLRSAAQAYSWAMVRNDFFDHVSPSGSTLVGRIRRTAYLASA